jgi:formylglycine-generating enzyme
MRISHSGAAATAFARDGRARGQRGGAPRRCMDVALVLSGLCVAPLQGCKVNEAAAGASQSPIEALVDRVTSQPREADSETQILSCPANMAVVEGFCIDAHEAFLVERRPDGTVVTHPPHERPRAGLTYEARSAAGALPQAYISRPEAAMACQNAGKRLCSLSEWYAACRGSAQTTYPYGSDFAKGKCNTGKAHLLSRFFGRDPNAWSYAHHFNSPILNQQPGFLAKSGEYADCTNDFGVFDMVGNLHEWVSDSVDPSLERKLPLLPGIRRSLQRTRGHGIFMGGFYSTHQEHGRGCGFITIGHEPKYHDYSTGFRCCAELGAEAGR